MPLLNLSRKGEMVNKSPLLAQLTAVLLPFTLLSVIIVVGVFGIVDNS